MMIEDDRTYYLRRAATQQRLADHAAESAAASAHRTLANLHRRRAGESPRASVLSPFGR